MMFNKKKLPKVKIQDVSQTLMPSKKPPLLEFIIIGEGKNLHQVVPFDKKAKYRNGSTIFKIENQNLFMQKTSFGRKKLTAIFFKDGTAIKIDSDKPNPVTAEILNLAKKSSALENKIKSMFTSHMDWKKIFFFIIIGVVAVVVGLIVAGGGFF